MAKRDRPDPRSGLDESAAWTPAFEGQRPPFEPETTVGAETRFEPGNGAAVTHGARADGKLRPLAERYLERLHEFAPTRDERADELAFERLAWMLARIEAAERWVDTHGVVDKTGRPQPVLAQLSTWENAARRLMVELGLTAASRAALRLAEAQTDYVDIAAVQKALVLVMSAGPEIARDLVAEGFVGEQLVRMFRSRFPQLVQERIAAAVPLALPPADDV